MAEADKSAQSESGGAMGAVLDYVRAQRTTGFLVIRDGSVLARANWPLPDDAGPFRAAFAYGANSAGELLEDVASQQKSFVAVLTAIAADKGLVEVERPVSAYLGRGWSKAEAAQEAAIRVVDLMTMTSGLGEDFTYAAAPGVAFLYNTPVYAVLKHVIAAAADQPLDTLTQAWLTGPAGMSDTAWRKRPAALGDVGNPMGLVTSPSDVARFGQMVLDDGRSATGEQVVSPDGLAALFEPTPANPAYGRLWWLNSGDFALRPTAPRTEGPLIPSAPRDLVAALGAMDRKLYVSKSLGLIVVRLGQAAPDKGFDEALWSKLAPVLA